MSLATLGLLGGRRVWEGISSVDLAQVEMWLSRKVELSRVGEPCVIWALCLWLL